MEEPEDGHPLWHLIDLAKDRKLISTREVEAEGILRLHLTELVSAGEIERVGRGLYAYAFGRKPPHWRYAVVCRALPRAVICALSAAHLHGLEPDEPRTVWVAVVPGQQRALPYDPVVEPVYMRAHLLEPYVRWLEAGPLEVRVTCPSKSVVDVFRLRRRFGTDVAARVLRRYLKRACEGAIEGSRDELLEVAERHRVAGTLRPYVEALESGGLGAHG